jgi:hypothetical protein
VNTWLAPALGMEMADYARYVAPPVEESLKAVYVVYLLARNKVGFVVDAAIQGFGIGTGFAVLENLYYVSVHEEATIWTWFVRGFGTAVMHGGTTAIVAMAARSMQTRVDAFQLRSLLPGLGAAIVLHSLYNAFLLQPLIATGLIVLVFPYVAIAVFQQSERDTRNWLGTGFDTDQELIRALRAGEFGATPVGRYLKGLRDRFPPEAIVDMMCLLRLRAELGIRAKGVLMMREAGFEAEPDPTIQPKFEELRYLEGSIGRTGMLAIKPFVHTSTRDLWQMNLLDEGQRWTVRDRRQAAR